MTATFASHGTLTANVVTTVTLTHVSEKVSVVNRSGAAEIYFNVYTVGAAPADPTVGGDDCYVLPATSSVYDVSVGSASVTVKLISSGTPTFSVLGG